MTNSLVTSTIPNSPEAEVVALEKSLGVRPKKTLEQSHEAFDYAAHFGSHLGKSAKTVLGEVFIFVTNKFRDLRRLGDKLVAFKAQCIRELGEKKAQKAFIDWLSSAEIGMWRSLVEEAMLLSTWYDSLPKRLQKLALTNASSWSRRALKLLISQSDQKLVESLLKAGKQTVKSIQSAIEALEPPHKFVLGEQATQADWQLVAQKLNICARDIEALKLEAINLASADVETGELLLSTDHIVAALLKFKYDVSSLLPKKKKSSGMRNRESALYSNDSSSLENPSKIGSLPVNHLQLACLLTQHESLEEKFGNVLEQRLDEDKKHLHQELAEVEKQFEELAGSMGLDKDSAFYLAKGTQALIAHQAKTSSHSTTPSTNLDSGNSERKLFTKTEVERMIADALTLDKERSSLSQIQATNEKLQQDYEQLLHKFHQLQQQLQQYQGLTEENWQYKQRIEQLERVLETATTNPIKLQDANQTLVQLLEEKTDRVEELNSQLEQYQQLTLPLNNEQLFVGAKVKILYSNDHWEGYTGVVTERFRDDWLVLLDCIREQGSSTKTLFKAGQLTFNLQKNASNNTAQVKRLRELESENQQLRLQLTQAEELAATSHKKPTSSDVVLNQTILPKFGEAAAVLGIPGWSCRGYCTDEGTLYTRLPEALCAFVKDLASNPELHPAF
jgi:hypothetical protein